MFKYKLFLPRTIFFRFLVIIITPVILAQIFAIYIFYQRHWSNVSGYMIDNLSNEVLVIKKLYQLNLSEKEIIKEVSNTLKLKFYLEKRNFTYKKIDNDSELKNFYNNLVSKINSPVNVNYNSNKNEIEIEIPVNNEILIVKTFKKKIDNPTTYIFILWMTGASTILTILSILFLRNQVKSISKLANIAEKFGKGIKIDNFKPSGAMEIKNAGKAFLKMKERIERQISQKTFMLSAVSHDLKTPITRIKLELEMIEQNSQIIDIKQDIREMEKMIDHYLDFAKGEDNEFAEFVNITEFINQIIENYKNSKIPIIFEQENIYNIFIKKESFKRAITNLIDNAIRFSSKEIKLNSYIVSDFLFIEINDDGPGIDDSQKNLVFKPFYRIDKSRNNLNGGVGLGLAIAKDIINSHAGDISLEDNIPNGLRAIIKLPI